jgi:hypothetical protein
MTYTKRSCIDCAQNNVIDAGVISLPETKAGQGRFVPLNDRAKAVMRMLHDRSIDSGKVFRQQKPSVVH